MLNALIPVFSLILLGGVLNYLKFPGLEFWRGAERLTYYLLFPALLFLKLSTTSVSGDYQLFELVILLVGFLVLVSLIIVIIGKVFSINPGAFTSYYQGGIRFNTYVGLAAVNGLLGDGGLAIAAVVVGIMIPFVNLLCIGVFAFSGDSDGKGLSSITKNIITNPLIVACVAGILWNNLDLGLPSLLVSVLDLLSATALPLGLLAVGAGVHISALSNATKPFFISSIIKLLIVPSIAYLMCSLTGQGQSLTMVIVIISSLPTASSAYILARELGGDTKSMAAIITGQTLLAMISMPLVIQFVM